MLESLVAPVAASARGLLRRPVFTALSVSLMALGIGAVAAIFTVVNATLLKPLPYSEPGQLYRLNDAEPAGVKTAAGRDSMVSFALSWFQLSRWRDETRAFESIAGYSPATMKLLGDGEPEPVQGAFVSAGFFETLGWRPMLGTLFTHNDERPGNGVAVISFGLWQRRFGGDPQIIGRAINLDDEPRTITAVMPEGYRVIFARGDIWTPMNMDATQMNAAARLVASIGRLKRGTTFTDAEQDLIDANKRMAAERPAQYGRSGVILQTLRESVYGKARAGLLVLFASVLLLLAVAAVNVTSLTLADAFARRDATMTRLAFGASPSDIMRLRLADAGLIAVVATALGLVVGQLGLGTLAAVLPDAFEGFGSISLDPVVILGVVGAALVAGLLAAAPAALAESGTTVAGFAGSASKAAGSVAENRRGALLLGTQVTVAVVLLIGAALLARNVQRLLALPTGYEAPGVTVVELTFSRTTYTTPEARSQYAQQLLDAVRAVPGVEAAATLQTRFVLNEFMQSPFEVEGKPLEPGTQQLVNIRHITPELLKVMHMRLLDGRAMEPTDGFGQPLVTLVSQSFVKQWFGNENPIGKHIRRMGNAGPQPWMEIVGVVEDIYDTGVGVENRAAFYVNYLQQNTATARPTIVVRARGSQASLAAALRRAIWSVDKKQTIDSIHSLEELLLRSAAQPRFAALVAVLFAASALILVISGIYAVTLYAVIRRSKEFGVRAALGAGPLDLVRTAMERSMRPVAVGAIAGALIAIPTSNAMGSALRDGVGLADVPLLAASVIGLLAVAAVAAFVPARRALAIPPATVMRDG